MSEAGRLRDAEVLQNVNERVSGIRRENIYMIRNGRKIRLPDHMGSTLAANMQSAFTLGVISCKESWRTGLIGSCVRAETGGGAARRQTLQAAVFSRKT